MISLMDLRDKLNDIVEFIESKNYYYETHSCEENEVIKVKMDYKLKDDIKGEIIRFGFCPKCNICYYHNDFEGNKS